MSFVTCKLIAQTGNQLFISAATIATALRNGVEYKIPRQTSSRKEWPCYIQHLPEYKGERILNHWEEMPDFSFKPIVYKPNLMLSGYFQSEEYFKDYREDILKAFNFPYEYKDRVAIHVRRGDYLNHPTKHPVVNLNYIAQAIHKMNARGNTKFLVFSDGMDWCREHINSIVFKDSQFEYSEGRTTIEDLTFMSHCKHQIIANSTFSWWAAWLNQNPEKIVISPSKDNWFGHGNAKLKTDSIIPETWEQIKY
jgi:hypothetical protein